MLLEKLNISWLFFCRYVYALKLSFSSYLPSEKRLICSIGSKQRRQLKIKVTFAGQKTDKQLRLITRCTCFSCWRCTCLIILF
jgi:hypothetical protein